jgi:hypothetical protein
MILVDTHGRVVNSGDIVWRGRKSYIFLAVRGERVEALTTDDRRMFVHFQPHELNLNWRLR